MFAWMHRNFKSYMQVYNSSMNLLLNLSFSLLVELMFYGALMQE